METGIAGRTVLVTGASGGIGRAIATAFGEEGARVVCHSFSKPDEMREWADYAAAKAGLAGLMLSLKNEIV